MFKKIIKYFCLMFLIIISAGIFNGCCGKLTLEMSVEFFGVDKELDYVSYIDSKKIGETIELELTVPVGFDHEGLVVQLNNKQIIPWEVTYSDPMIEEEYRYTVEKKIKISLAKVTKDFTLNIDMSKVKRRALDLVVSNSILNITKNEDGNNLSVISVNPESLNRLTKLDSSNILARRNFVDNKATVYYDEYIILCYDVPYKNKEIPTLYTNVNHFTDFDKVKTLGSLRYCEYPVSQRGNLYYNVYENNVAKTSTRLYYLGRVQEGFNIYNKIPNYITPNGFVMEDNMNKFSLLTNITDYNSDSLSINVYKKSSLTYNENNLSLDKVGDLVLEKIDYKEIYKNRYSRFDMYIGKNIKTDALISEEDRETLTDTLYISIQTDINLDTDGSRDDINNYLHFHLLHYELQSNTVPHFTFSEIETSEKGCYILKLDLTVINSYIDSLTDYSSGTNYATGNAILYVQMDLDYIESSSFKYVKINYPILYNSEFRGRDHRYFVQFYLLNDDATKDYGFLEMNKWDDDVVYFRKDKFYDSANNFKENIYLNVIGMEISNSWTEYIEQITVEKSNSDEKLIGDGRLFVNVDNPRVFNGCLDIPINLLGNSSTTRNYQFTPEIYINLSNINDGYYNVNLNGIEFSNVYDAIFMTNNIMFSSEEDFERVTELTKRNIDNIDFGIKTEIYYFVVSDSTVNFDIYMGSNSEEYLLTNTKQLLDIVGNAIRVNFGGIDYDVYVKYQAFDLYDTVSMCYYAYN